MKRLFVIEYGYRDGLDEDDMRHLLKKFLEFGTGPTPIAHYERLDGKGGYMIREFEDDPEKVYELTVRYGPYLDFRVTPVTTMEDAVSTLMSVYG